jgi:c-di-GMP-binding flagellar brake protein YcgR
MVDLRRFIYHHDEHVIRIALSMRRLSNRIDQLSHLFSVQFHEVTPFREATLLRACLKNHAHAIKPVCAA